MFKIKRLLNKIGIDRAIGFSILTRLIQVGGGLGSIIFIVRFLSPSEQGYYYTFSSIVAIQVFFELGLTVVITQYTAHEFAHLTLSDLSLQGSDYYQSRISSLLHFCVKWFGFLSILLFFLLIAVGFYFFDSFGKNANIEWRFPWIILCLSTSLNLFIDPILAYFDGLSEIRDMAKVRLIQKTIYVVLLFLMLVLHAKLYALGIASLISISVNYLQIFFTKRFVILKNIWIVRSEWIINYYKEIFPFQWRIALSWISGYFIFQLFNPILFATGGAILAGKMGMTLAALNSVLSISLSWINTKVPLFSALIAKSDYITLDKIFNNTLKQACFVCLFTLIIIVISVLILQYNNINLGHRFLNWLPLMLLSIATFINQLIFGLATYLRCHKQEPLLLQSIVLAVLTAFSSVVFGKLFSVNGIVISYTILIVFVSLTWTIYTYNTKKKLWH